MATQFIISAEAILEAKILLPKKPDPMPPAASRVPLPPGYRNGCGRCPKCGGSSFLGVLISTDEDEQDPTIFCQICGNLF
jgi:hypothetical protein